MSLLVSTASTGVVAGQKQALYVPPNWKVGGARELATPLVVLCHGAGGDGWTFTKTQAPAGGSSPFTKVRMICERYGLPCVSGDQDGAPASAGHSVANDASQSAAMSLATWAQGVLGCKTGAGSLLVFGTSMGSHLAWNLHKNNPGTVRASAHALVTVSVQSLYDASANTDGVYKGWVDTAYAGAWAAAAATHDPYQFAAQMRGLPVGLFGTTDDPDSGGQSGVESMAAAIGGTAVEMRFYGPGGHDLDKISDADVAAFLMRYSGLS